MIITVTLNPAIDKTIQLNNFKINHVNRVQEVRQDPGGKGINVSKMIKALGGDSIAFSIIGGDTGNFIRDALNDAGINGRYMTVSGNTRTNIKIVDKVNGTHSDINESGPVIDDEMNDKVKTNILNLLSPGDILVLSGSLLLGMTEDFYQQLIESANDLNVLTILDAEGKKLEYGLKAKPSIIKPNIHELESIAMRPLTSDEEIIKFTKEIINQNLVTKGILVSKGEEGALWISKESVVLVKPIRTEVVSTVGAGDAMVAAMAIGIDQNMDVSEWLRMATATAVKRISSSGMLYDIKDSISEMMTTIDIVTLDN